MLTSSFFSLELDGAIAHISMNRPEKANGMNEAFWIELPFIIEQLDQDPNIRVLVISGEGKHFSSGIDFSTFNVIFELLKEEPSRAGYALYKEIMKFQHAFTVLEKARFPVIAAIHGVCMGAAVDFITACDLRVAATDTEFSIEEVNIGMAADVGTLQRLPKLIPVGIAKELSLTGRKFSAEEAKSWGLVSSVHDNRADTLQAAMSLATQIASKSPVATTGIKRSINYAVDHTIADSLEQIATWNASMLRTEDLMKSIQARKEKNQAVFNNLIDTRSISNM